MTIRKVLFGVCLMMVGVSGDLWSRGIDAPSTIMVIPARQRVVEFGFDLIRQNDVTLIAYQQVGPDLMIHLWNGREWLPMTPATYFSGSFLLGAPQQAILVGDDGLLPAVLQTSPDWSRKTKRIQTIEIASLVNECGHLLNFYDAQWKWLARKYGLVLTDSNAARRQWGKYGPPGQEWYRLDPPSPDRPVSVSPPVPPVAPVAPVAPVEGAQVTMPSVRVIPDNAPILVPDAPPAAIAPEPLSVPTPAPDVVPVPVDILPPGATVELPCPQ